MERSTRSTLGITVVAVASSVASSQQHGDRAWPKSFKGIADTNVQ
jgi:hypothetical protein